jgi:vacuolar-type H+-ATPase subunit C/Vma6
MTSISTYGFVNAKVRTKRSFLLTATLYHSMIEAQNLQELCSILLKTRYREMIEQLKSPTPLVIERALFGEEVRQLQQIAKHMKNDPHRMISLSMERYEIERLKIVLRQLHRKDKAPIPLYRKKILYDLPVDLLLSSDSLKSFVLLLEGTPYHKILTEVLPLYDERKTLFPLELALDKDLFNRIWEATTLLNRRDLRIARRLFGIEIDLRNIDWINRFRTYYNAPSADVEGWLLPHGYRLGSEDIQALLSKENVSDALAKATAGFRVPLPEDREGDNFMQAIESFLYRVLFSEAKRSFGEYPFSIGAILGYIVLQRIESKNLRTLIHAKSYDLTTQEIENLLIH